MGGGHLGGGSIFDERIGGLCRLSRDIIDAGQSQPSAYQARVQLRKLP